MSRGACSRGGQTSAPLYSDVAYAGLPYGLDYSQIVTLIYRQTDVVTPGLVLCQLPDGTGAIPSVAVAAASPTTIVPFGIFVRDATMTMAPNPIFFPPTAPPTAEALSVMQRGAIWAQAGGTCTAHGPVKFDANGLVSDTGAYGPIPHAVFLTTQQAQSGGVSIVVVGLQSPLAA